MTNTTLAEMTSTSLLINGDQKQASNGGTFERRNPLDGSVATVAAAATKADALAAVEAASAAFPAWSKTSPSERRALLLKAAQAIESKSQAFIDAMASETGSSAIWAASSMLFPLFSANSAIYTGWRSFR